MGILKQADFDQRIANLREAARRNGLDAILVFSTESEPAQVRYFSDYWPSFETAAVLVPVEGESALIIGPESLTYATARTKIPNVIQLMDFRESSQPDYPGSKLPKWKDVVQRYKLGKIGVSGWYLFPYTMMTALMKAMGGAKNVVMADEMVRPLYMKKSAAEIR
jgi:Xaa-Pro aminopeptidase